MTNPNRVNAGVPTGGQFASHDRADAATTLTAAPTGDPQPWIIAGAEGEWNNELGWVDDERLDDDGLGFVEDAPTRFTAEEKEQLSLPLGGAWVHAPRPEFAQPDDVTRAVVARQEKIAKLIADSPQLGETLALDSDTALSFDEANWQTEMRSGQREITDATAIALLEGLGDDYPTAGAAARGYPVSKADVWVDLQIAYGAETTTGRQKRHIDMLYTWLLHGPDND